MFRLALALGGMTVRELRRRVDFDELRGWQLFEEKYGMLHTSIRFEGAVARAVAPFLENAKPSDLMPWPKETPEDATLDGVFKLLAGAAKSAKEKGKGKPKGKKTVRKNRGK